MMMRRIMGVADSSGDGCVRRFVQPRFELSWSGKSNDLIHYLAAAKQHQCRHAGDGVATGQFRAVVHVRLDELQSARKLSSQLFEQRREHLARPTPWRVKIHYDRSFRLQYFLLKICFRQFDTVLHSFDFIRLCYD